MSEVPLCAAAAFAAITADAAQCLQGYLTHKNSDPLGPYSKTMRTALWKPQGGGLFLMSEEPLNVLPIQGQQNCNTKH